jgi:MFS family permease
MTPRAWTLLIALSMARIAFGYQFQTIAVLGTDLIDRFALSYTQLGALIGTYMTLGAVAALPLGLLGRRFGEGRVLAIGLLLMTAGSVHSALSAGPQGIGLGRAAAGVGAVAMIVLQNKIIAEWFKGPWFMVAISVTVCAFPVGMGLAGILLPPALQGLGLPAALMTDALFAGLAAALFLASYREPPGTAQPARRFSLPGRRESMLLLIAGTAWMAYTAGFSGFASYLPASLGLRGFDVAQAGMVMAVATWGNVVGTLSGAPLANRFGGFNIFLAGTSFLVLGMLGLTLTPWPVAFALVLGVLGSIHPGVVMAIGTMSARPENRAVGMGLFYTVYYVGGSIAPAACGAVADATGDPVGGLLAATALSAMAIPVFMLHRRLSRQGTVMTNP